VVVAWGLLLLSVVQYSPTSARNSPTSSRITTPSATSARFNTPAAAPTDDPADAAPAAREAAAAIGALPAIHAPAALDALSAEASAAPADGAPAPENTHADHLDAKHGEAIEDPGAEAALAPSGLEMERDDQTGLMVPVFWQPNDDAMQLDAGEPTIFLMIASYRDFQCRDTIASALTRAKFPGRVRVSAVQQNRPEDEGCAEPHVPCEEDPTQVLCTRASQVKVYEMDANEATGPVYARHVGNRMYRGEAFALQIDAHCVFVNGWDTQLIQQWKATKNDMAVLSTYLTDVEGSVSVGGDSLRNTRPIMCNSDYEGSGTARYLRHGSQPEAVPAVLTEPMLQPFWAAGFSFARGHFISRVPYDCCLPMVFMGEEISMGIRGWTHGYDHYAPQSSVVFHEYAQKSSRRRHVPKFWEAGGKKKGEGQRSLKRLTSLIKMSTDIDPSEWDHVNEEKYGLGTVRDVSQFYALALVDTAKREAQPLCRFVESGAMHREFHQKHLRADGGGIDYDGVDFDVQGFLDERLYAPIQLQLQRAISAKSRPRLEQALNEAGRLKIRQRKPSMRGIVEQAETALRELK